jgi:hypothetical protein
MICSQISTLIGASCHPLSEDGSVAFINTPFTFEDGTGIPVYVEKVGEQIRFFDDGEVILHLRGRGLPMDDQRKTKFLRNITEPNQVLLSEMGELEIWADSDNAPAAFARYIGALLSLIRWESDQIGVATDMSLLVSEVALCLKTLKPSAELIEGPEYVGISGHKYKLDFNFDGEAVLAISTHHAAVSSAAKKLLDIRSAAQNERLKVLVVIDDRLDAESARKDGLILDAVASVWMMTRLEKQAGISGALN